MFRRAEAMIASPGQVGVLRRCRSDAVLLVSVGESRYQHGNRHEAQQEGWREPEQEALLR